MKINAAARAIIDEMDKATLHQLSLSVRLIEELRQAGVSTEDIEQIARHADRARAEAISAVVTASIVVKESEHGKPIREIIMAAPRLVPVLN